MSTFAAQPDAVQLNLPAITPRTETVDEVRRCCDAFRSVYERLRAEIGKVIVGQHEIVEQTLMALFANGHVLLEGVPGLGKTLLVSTLGKTLTLPYARIQFTPDLMPADITGTAIVIEDEKTGHREFSFRPGPIFHQLVLADEINRATPKSQAALLEAMQERSITVAGQTHKLTLPFFVMATQNPIDQEGTYPLPEAQLDRFIFKIAVPYTTRQEMNTIIQRTTRSAQPKVEPVLDGPFILAAQRLARRIIIAPHVQDYAVRLVLATHPNGAHADPKLARYVHVGVSPRGAQAIVAAAKVKAMIEGRYAVSIRDVHSLAPAALRHRIIRSFEAESDGISSDEIIRRLIAFVPREDSPQSATESHGDGKGGAR
ncbi:MAG TPA: AAA family ATPase [Phycisphaerales bacterium]|nr:AAA family ATPase [Phycisphaerales bacterium]